MTLAAAGTPRRLETCQMPELPDITVYVDSLESRIAGVALRNIRLNNLFLLRTATPPIASAAGRRVTGVRRMGKRIVISLERDVHLVIHLMVAGRLKWLPAGTKPPGKSALAVLEFDTGALVSGEQAVLALHAGGLEVLESTLKAFSDRLKAESHTLKRALTDPHIFSGIGNAYSDEILHRARLSPIALTGKLSDDEVARLYEAIRSSLTEWTARLRKDAAGQFPAKVTAFHEQMAVHGRYGQPCPVCGSPVQRIVYGAHETNYCARCQTGGKILADRALSKLLKKSWPRSIDAIE
jgi:formamidopyrimidine-DNA glycosylase